MTTSTTPNWSFVSRSLALAALVIALALVALLIGAQTASAQQGVTWDTGNVCVQDYRSGANCNSQDVKIASISPSLSDVCLFVGDTATAYFVLEIEPNATTRYDIGLFIATDGNSALSGDVCYHDVLQPAYTLDQIPPLGFQTTNVGPYRNFDDDFCADVLQNDGVVYYRTQVQVTIDCVDNDNDGIVDPVSTCTSWDVNAQGTCSNISQAFPGTNPKCSCSDAPTGILLYKGLDGGDLPDTYDTLFTSDGARHAIQDPTGTGTPETQGGQVAIWLGNTVDYAWANPTDETTAGGFPTPDALGDDANNTDDEDGVAFVAPWYIGANGGKIRVSVNASGAGECTVGNDCTVAFWLDWDNSGAFNNNLFSSGGERYQFTLTGGTGIAYDLVFDTPATWNGGQLAARVRLYDNSSAAPISPLGLVTNGEVEDYINPVGTLAVTLSDFSAVCDAQTPVISWSSISEFDTQGYNLLRGLSANGWDTQLNTTLIPAQYPGSTQGGSYQWQDTSALPDVEHYYWLQDVSFGGVTGLHGPISVTCMAPTAVGLSSLGAEAPAAGSLTWWAVALTMVVLFGVLTVWQQRVKTR